MGNVVESETPIHSSLELGSVIRAQRKRLALTQLDVAGLGNTGNRFIVDLENGKPTVPLQPGRQTSPEVQAFFENLLPEGELRNYLAKAIDRGTVKARPVGVVTDRAPGQAPRSKLGTPSDKELADWSRR
jgi:hypothetical protein